MKTELSKKQREEIRNEVWRRYTCSERTATGGAAHAHGNWAGPTIKALLDTCDRLERGHTVFENPRRGNILEFKCMECCTVFTLEFLQWATSARMNYEGPKFCPWCGRSHAAQNTNPE